MSSTGTGPVLQVLDPSMVSEFETPSKKIHDGNDVAFFLSSKAYADIMTWILQLNAAMYPRKQDLEPSPLRTWPLGGEILGQTPRRLVSVLDRLDALMDEAPPEPGPRRFGNVAFRTWHRLVEERIDEGGLLGDALPPSVTEAYSGGRAVETELRAYFLGSLGSAERLDYGSGHELSFLAFLGAVWKLGGFEEASPTDGGGGGSDGSMERDIVLGPLARYFELVRKVIATYNLEPAGSHGVWGLDDHSFAPYIFGSAQYGPAVSHASNVPPPAEGSLPGAPRPEAVTKAASVERERRTNLYFGAVGFINDVKKGPFWEHSPMLFDISGVKGGWAKINKGMIKMYDAEVLGKFPVVQHFPFGQLFRWERDPSARPVAASTHVASQPTATATNTSATTTTKKAISPAGGGRGALAGVGAARAPPKLNPAPAGFVGTAAPWAKGASAQDPLLSSSSSTAAGAAGGGGVGGSFTPTTAPWASRPPPPPPPSSSQVHGDGRGGGGGGGAPEPTKAPWARR